MGLFNNQFANVIEWNESRDDVIFWLARNKEIKRGAPRYSSRTRCYFSYIMEKLKESLKMKEIMKSSLKSFFLTTLKGLSLDLTVHFESEVLFVNTKEF